MTGQANKYLTKTGQAKYLNVIVVPQHGEQE